MTRRYREIDRPLGELPSYRCTATMVIMSIVILAIAILVITYTISELARAVSY